MSNIHRDGQDEDYLKDISPLFGESAPPPQKQINWDDYNFNFDDEAGADPQRPVYRPRVSDETEQFSIDYMRRLHENAGNPQPPRERAVDTAGYRAAPVYTPVSAPPRPHADAPKKAPKRAPRKAPATPAPIYVPQPDEDESEPVGYTRKPQKKHRLLKVILRIVAVFLALLVLFVAVMAIFGQMPTTGSPLGVRRKGCCTVLLAGTDAEGTRTDTLMLLYIDRPNKHIRLLSIPRDTMVNRDNPVPKINGAYAANGSGVKGMGYLLDYVKDLVGYRPDGYMLIDLGCFVELVNIMGGVKYDVPMDMYYDDPSQDLHIDLKAGEQRLNGEEAMGLVRFRSGYASADLERVSVQRSFLKSALKQWTMPWKAVRAPFALSLLLKNTMTDLSAFNLSWLATSVVLCGTDSLESDTLPGSPATVNGGAYYVEDVSAAAELVNARYNPYESEISGNDLHPYGR